MTVERPDATLPENTLIFREYQAHIDERCVTVAITLSKSRDASAGGEPAGETTVAAGKTTCAAGETTVAAGETTVDLSGYIFVTNLAKAPCPQMTWTYDGMEVVILPAEQSGPGMSPSSELPSAPSCCISSGR
jgi:hypothetical protein